ncbi:hypothetical protein [Halomonas ramblicola]|uniref:hypothetical protein n=1 Tax=Halomonas ramblicola TaxID=747349 RepID=UPI0025B50259|nr:hypothetical protein [Halomonas ramblicola]MDN3522760.1 hypothetical protein [Halomonas ramblicola]
MLQRLVPSILLMLLGLALAGPVSALQFNTAEVERHDAWQSMTLVLGEERLYRAAEGDSYGDSLFSVNYTPGACDAPWLELRVDLGERQPESRTVNRVPADLRVDHETIHTGRGEFRVERGDSGFYVHFDLDDRPLLLDELRRGETLRLRLMRGPDDPWFMVFALAGADAAMDRAQRACRAAVR